MKRILYIHQYFKTPEEGGAIRSYYIAKGLVDNGYEVDMITSHNEKDYLKKEIEGIAVHYLPVYYDNTMGKWRRIFAFARFLLKAVALVKTLRTFDLCYASSTPLTIGWLAMRLKSKLGLPFFFEVRDLWPEAPIQMGFIRNPLIKAFLYHTEKKIYQSADKVIALSPGIRDSIERKVPNPNVYVVPNMADTEFFAPPKKVLALASAKPLVVSYIGAAGKVNGLSSLIEIINHSKRNGINLRFNIAAKGSELEKVRLEINSRGLADIVSFLPFGNKKSVRKLLNRSDACYVSFAQQPVLSTNSPNKYFDALAAGKLVIVNSPGWLREITEEHTCGFYAHPQSPGEFARKIMPYLEDRSRLLSHQKNARELAELYYSRNLQVQKVLKLLDNEYQMKVNEDTVFTLTA